MVNNSFIKFKMVKIKLTTKIKKTVLQLKKLNPDKIILFGSYAKNQQDENSDIDILFIKEKFKERRIIDRIHSIYKKITVSGADIIPYTPMEIQQRIGFNYFFLQDALKEGIVLYEKKN